MNFKGNIDHPQISCLVVTYQSERVIRGCLDTLKLSDLAQQMEILVADNLSTDSTRQVLEDTRDIRFVVNEKNYGFAKAANDLARSARGDFLFFLNPDCLIQENLISSLVSMITQHPGAVAAGPVVAGRVGSRLAGAGYEPTFRALLEEVLFLPHLLPANCQGIFVRRARVRPGLPLRVHWLAGTAFLIRAEDFWRFHGFDEEFFMYCEDMDLGRKIRHSGAHSLLHTDVTVQHLGGSSHESWRRAIAVQKLSLVRYLHRSAKGRTFLMRFVLRMLVEAYFIERRVFAQVGTLMSRRYLPG